MAEHREARSCSGVAWRSLVMMGVAVLALTCAPQARGVLYRFDDWDELDDWELLTDRQLLGWWVQDGVMKITGTCEPMVAVWAIRDLAMLAGRVSLKIRFVDVGPFGTGQVGVVFRLQPIPDRDGYPGQYVFLDGIDGTVVWQSRRLWAWHLPDYEVVVGGGAVEKPLNWLGAELADQWFGLRVDANRAGWHQVYADLGRGWTPVLSADQVMSATVWGHIPAWVDPATLADGDPVGGIAMKPLSELADTGDPLFGIGGVGLYVAMDTDDCRGMIQIDDFEARVWLGVEDEAPLATTWAEIRSLQRGGD